MLRGGLRAVFTSARHQDRIRAQPDVKHGEGDRNPPFEMRQRDVLVFDWLVLLFSVVTADEPLVAEQRDRKLVFKLVDHRELRRVQVLVRVHQRPPDEAHDQARGGDQSVPPMVSKRREEDHKQRYQTGIQREQIVVCVLPLVAGMLRGLDEQLVLFQQVVLIFVAVLLRRPAL